MFHLDHSMEMECTPTLIYFNLLMQWFGCLASWDFTNQWDPTVYDPLVFIKTCCAFHNNSHLQINDNIF